MAAHSGSKVTGTVTLAKAMGLSGKPRVAVNIKLNGVFIPEDSYPAGVYASTSHDVISADPK